MSYFMSPQTHLGLLPSGQGERGSWNWGWGWGNRVPLTKFLPGLGEVELLLKAFGLTLESILLNRYPKKASPIANCARTHLRHFPITCSIGTGRSYGNKSLLTFPTSAGSLGLVLITSGPRPCPSGPLPPETKNNIPFHSCLCRWGCFFGFVPWPL